MINRRRDGVLRTINSQAVCDAIERNFAATYLTVLGIIQSIVLGMLVSKFYLLFETGGMTRFALASGILTFTIVVLVWHAYQWYPYLNRWPPDLWDSLIPFLLGASQGACALSLSHGKHYFFALLLTGVGGLAAYTNTRNKIQPEDFQPRPVYDLQLKHLKLSQLATALGIVYAGFVWLAFAQREMCFLWLLGPYIVGAVLFWSSSHYWGEILSALGVWNARGTTANG